MHLQWFCFLGNEASQGHCVYNIASEWRGLGRGGIKAKPCLINRAWFGCFGAPRNSLLSAEMKVDKKD